MKQPIYKFQSQAADANGGVVFTFEYVPMSLTWVGSFNIAHAPPAAQWTLNSGDIQDWGTWYGLTTYGPVRLDGMLQAKVIGVGLNPGVIYTCQFIGYSTDEDVDPIPPHSGIISVTSVESSIPIASNISTTVGNVGGNYFATYPVPPTIRYLTIYISAKPHTGVTRSVDLPVQIQDRATSSLVLTPNPVVYRAFTLPDDGLPRIYYAHIDPILARSPGFSIVIGLSTLPAGDDIVYSIVGSQSNPATTPNGAENYQSTGVGGTTLIHAYTVNSIARIWSAWVTGNQAPSSGGAETNITVIGGAQILRCLMGTTGAGVGAANSNSVSHPNGVPVSLATGDATFASNATGTGSGGVAWSWDRLL